MRGWAVRHAPVDADEVIRVLVPGELTPERVRDRAGMVGTVLILALVFGAVLGALWVLAGGAL